MWTGPKGLVTGLYHLATTNPVTTVNKVTEGRPHVVDMIKNGDISLVINTVEERRNAIADSRQIRTSSLLARVTTFTTIAGAEAAVEGMKYMDKLDVYSVQELHAQRDPLYREVADVVIDTSRQNINTLVHRLLRQIELRHHDHT